MAVILETTTTLDIVNEDFTLLTEYSGEPNPNVTYDVLFNLNDGANPIEGVIVEINGVEQSTDINGQTTFSLVRDDFTANLSKVGYQSGVDSFTVFDQNLTRNIVLQELGSFDQSYGDSFNNITE